jgi:RNA polymerase sigma factor (sigma-70 family)
MGYVCLMLGSADSHTTKDYTDDSVLLASLKKQDIKAYEFLYLSSRNRLYVLAESILRDRELARDITHEFLADFWESKLYEKVRFSLKSYLYNALRNRAISHLRGEKAYAKVIEGIAGLEESEAAYPLENADLRVGIETAIQNLPLMARNVFTMHYIQHMSHTEISESLGITRSTVSSHMDRALKQLRAQLKKSL